MKFKKTMIVTMATAVAMALPIAPAQAVPQASATSVSVSAASAETSDVQEVADGLELIMQIPDEVLAQGDAATHSWLKANRGEASAQSIGSVVRNDGGVSTLGWGDAAGCAAAIGGIALGVAVPAVKLLRIKKDIKAIGGVWESAKLLVGAGTAAEKGEAVVTALGSLVAELTGVAGVAEACPKVFK